MPKVRKEISEKTVGAMCCGPARVRERSPPG